MALPPAIGGTPSSTVRIIIRADDRARRTFDLVGLSAHRLQGLVRNLDIQFRGLDRIWTLLAVGSGAALIKSFVNMAAQLQKTRLQIGVFTRDFEKIPEVLEDIFALARKVPIDVQSLTDIFIRLKASGIDPIINSKGEGPLKNLVDAVAAFGGGEEIFKRAGIAIQQMAGKGVISMEELRQQLGEAIPTAMRVMAAQMEISVSELISRVTRGQLEFEEGFENLDKGFKRFFGGSAELQMNTVLGQITQVKRAFQELSDELNTSGAMNFFTVGLKLLVEQIDKFTAFIGTKAGVDFFKNNIDDLAESFARLSQPIVDVIDILGSLSTVIANIFGSLPSEILSGGILGLILFGRFIGPGKGILGGIILSQFGNMLTTVVDMVGATVQNIMDIGAAAGLDIPSMLQYGLIGLLFFGRFRFQAAAAGATAGALESFQKSLGDAIGKFTGAEAIGQSLGGLIGGSMSPEQLEDFRKGNEFFNKHFGRSVELLGTGERAVTNWGKGVENSATKMKGMVEELEATNAALINQRESLEASEVGGLSDKQEKIVGRFGTFVEKLRIRAGGSGAAMKAFALSAEFQFKQVTDVIGELEAQITRLDKEGTNLDSFLTGTEDQADATALAVAKVEAKFAGFARQIENIRQKIEKQVTVQRLQNELIGQLKILKDKMEEGEKREISRAEQRIALQIEENAVKAAAFVRDSTIRTNLFEMEVSFDKVGLASMRANQRVSSAIKSLNNEIIRLKKATDKGLMDKEVFEKTEANLNALINRVIIAGVKLREQMEFNASDYGQFMNSIANSIEGATANAIESLITRTGTARDILTAFWRDVTRALSEYLAKQALVAVFGSTASTGLGFNIVLHHKGNLCQVILVVRIC
jgi:tape measure domain-containing protein